MSDTDEMEVRRNANPLGEPVIRISSANAETGDFGRLIGLRPIGDDEQEVYQAIPFSQKDMDRVYVTEVGRRGVLALRSFNESCDPVICYLTKEGEADRARLLVSNAIRDTMCGNYSDRHPIHVGRDSLILPKFSFVYIPGSPIKSVFWMNSPCTFKESESIGLIDFRDRAITERMFGLIGRTKSRLMDDIKGYRK